MQLRLGSLAALLAIGPLLGGCPRSTSPAPSGPQGAAGASLEPVPVTVDAESVAPMAGHDPSARSPLLALMEAENARWIERLRGVDEAPAYYLAYHVHEKRGVVLEAEDGALTTDEDDVVRALDVDVRVGSPALDNEHPIEDPQLARLTSFQRLGLVPFGSDEKAVRHHLWLETDRRYREAALMLRVVKTQAQVFSQRDAPPDFSHEPVETFVQPVAELEYDRAHWEPRVRACSKKVRRGVATGGGCRLDLEVNTVYFVNSEGSVVQRSWTNARFMVQVGVKADDGMPLSRFEQRYAPTPADLPEDADVDAMIETITTDLDALHEAPVVDPYVGPAILEGRAAAVFFHEVFGHRIEGHRQKDKNFGRTFTKKIGQQIMPEWLTVYDDPTLRRLNGEYLNGFYRFDDQGVRAQRAELVEDGVFQGFVLGRTPIEGFPNSNGHGRAEPGLDPVSRQGNLVVEANASVDQEELYAQLIAEVKRQGKPYGMVFTDISGGFTNTNTVLPQNFKVEPIMSYRLYPDGRKELVRGVDITGTPLTALGSILAAGRPLETFNGMCGAESGWVPVSASSPSLLFRSLEVERGFQPTNMNPVLPPPSVRATGGSR